MLTLNINKITVQVPTEFRQVPIKTGVQVIQHSVERSILNVNDKIAIISTLTNLEPNIFMLMTDETINSIYEQLNFLKRQEQELILFKSFKLNNVLYGMIDLHNMTVHEYADIEFYLSESEYPLENLDKIMTVMFRPIVKKKQNISNILKNILLRLSFKNLVPKIYEQYEIKKYEDNDIQNKELFANKMDMGFALAAFQTMMAYRLELNELYPVVFKPEIKEEDKDQYDDPATTKQQNKTFEQIWGMFHCINMISNDLFEREAWYKKNIKEFFNYLSYFNQKIQVENERSKAQQNINQ